MQMNEEITEQELNQLLLQVPKNHVICYDIETTGLTDDDEVVQLSIIDGNGDVLFDEYIKPSKHKRWDQAQKIHGISPEDVANKPSLEMYKDVLNDIFSKAEVIVGYNNISFDNRFMERANIHIPENAFQYDVMLRFAPIYGEYNYKYGNYKWQKLITCAKYFDFQEEGKFHDSLTDVRATLHCYDCLIHGIKKEISNQTKLKNKVSSEYHAYKQSLLELSKEEIIDKSYQTSIKENYCFLIKGKIDDLSDFDIDSLLAMDNIIDECYGAWMDNDLVETENLVTVLDDVLYQAKTTEKTMKI